MIQEKRLIDQTYMHSCPGDPLGVQGPDPESRIHALLQQRLRIESLRQSIRCRPASLLVEFKGVQDGACDAQVMSAQIFTAYIIEWL